MTEIDLFTQLRPPPPDDAERIREAARARLAEAMGPAPGPLRPWHPSRRRRTGLVAAAGMVIAAAAIVIPVVLPGRAGPFITGAWAVERNPDGTIMVTVRQLKDPAGLERALRADGVPAYVRYVPLVENPKGPVTAYSACDYFSTYTGHYNFGKVFSFPAASAIDKFSFVIHPAAMPPATAVLVQVSWESQQEQQKTGIKDSSIGTQFTLTRDGDLGPCHRD